MSSHHSCSNILSQEMRTGQPTTSATSDIRSDIRRGGTSEELMFEKKISKQKKKKENSKKLKEIGSE